MPATVDKAKDLQLQGQFAETFRDLPFQNEIDAVVNDSSMEMDTNSRLIRLNSFAYMFKYYWQEMSLT